MYANRVYGWRPMVKATKVITGLAESNVSLPPDGWLKVTCGLTACTPGSALGPTLGNESGRTLYSYLFTVHGSNDTIQLNNEKQEAFEKMLGPFATASRRTP